MRYSKIWCCGSHGTGKTTQVEYFLQFHPEFARMEFKIRNLKQNGVIKINREAAPWDEVVMLGDAMLSMLSTSAPFISDRSWIDKCAYNQALSYPQELLDAHHIVNVNSFFGFTDEDIYFYFPIGLPIEDDGVRSTDLEYQKEVDYWIQFYLNYFIIPYIVVPLDSVQNRYLFMKGKLEL